MEYKYTYVRQDFPGSQYNTTALQNEIKANENLEPIYLYINTFGNDIDIFFSSELSPQENGYLDSIVANHNMQFGIVADPIILEGVSELESADDPTFGTPSPNPLASGNTAYSVITVYGQNGPDLSNVTGWTLTWDLNNTYLNSFNLSTSNGIPSWWLNLIPLSTHTFAGSSPSLTLAGTNIANLDGNYWVNRIGDDFVMVSKSGTFSIMLSNAAADYIPPQYKQKILLIDPISHQMVNSGHEFNVFGTEFHIAKSAPEQTTTLRSYQDALVLNVEDLPKGRYRIGCNFRYSLSVTNNLFYARINLNGNSINEALEARIPNTANRWYNSFTFYEVLEGDNEIKLQYYGGNGTARISDMIIELWRAE